MMFNRFKSPLMTEAGSGERRDLGKEIRNKLIRLSGVLKRLEVKC
jgi:hypothetical protein